ncbi:MAG: heme exporter protein CcmD [Duodenibacillus sp.]|jgi:heme exporter protein CcmD|nr:heme exporter protein CcmD [Duodenibacillus sp.]
MEWTSFSHFLHMDGHGFYVWTAYGMLTLMVVSELISLGRRRVKAVNRLAREARANRAKREL